MRETQSIIRKQSSGSVTIFWLDREALLRNLREAALNIGTSRPEVQTVAVFGSAATGRAVPGSDADVLIVASESSARILDRPLLFSSFFENIGVGVDLFVYTANEVRRGTIPLVRHALDSGIVLFSRESGNTSV
jgi:predicted nucleotidyltransferase